jgi:hypothetical protein
MVVASHPHDADSHLDKIDAATTFRIERPLDRGRSRGLVRLPTEIEVHTPKGERQSEPT